MSSLHVMAVEFPLIVENANALDVVEGATSQAPQHDGVLAEGSAYWANHSQLYIQRGSVNNSVAR